MALERALRVKLLAWLLLPGLCVIAALLLWQHNGTLKREAGSALFDGKAVLAGRLVGHTNPLPVLATRCSNCHDIRDRAPGGPLGASSATPAFGSADGSYGGALNRERLIKARHRRGGPPSAYDAAALCAVLRAGIDPAHVMIASTMPRYEASDEHCELLWSFLTSR